jgi:nicotinate-nucleotide adenylyltransferase
VTTREGSSRRIGLLGGTFDPPHVGHLVLAREVREALRLDELRLVVAADPPHKGEGEAASAEIRARMVEACLGSGEGTRLGVSRVELERDGPSWTVETLRELHRREPGRTWFFVLGADQLAELATWREPEEIARLATLVAVARDGRDPRDVDPGVDVPWITVPVTRVDVSSSAIRSRVRAGLPVRWLVPEAALRIIEEEGLYVAHGDER